MTISGAGQVFVFGCLGGMLLELLRWWKLRTSVQFPVYARAPLYWLLTLAMIIAGGAIAAVYGSGTTSAILAMNVGASAPAIIGALAAPPDKMSGASKGFSGSGKTGKRIRSFLAFGP